MIGVIATGPGEALLRSRGDDKVESDDFWLEPVDAGHSPRWRVALPVDAASAVGFGGLAVADTQVIVLGRGPDGAIARALDRATGEQQWSVALPKIAEPDARPEPSVVIDGPRALFLRGIAGQRATSIDAVALADGALLWTYHAGPLADVRPLAPGRLLVAANHGSVVIDGATGDVGETLDGVDVLCPLADGVLLNQGGDAAILTAAPVRTLPAIDRLLVASEEWCGSRDGDVVVAMYPRDTSLESTAVRRAADTGQVRWTTPLGRRSLAEMVVVDGRLPRFLPVYLSGKFEDDARELAVLDLDDGRVVQRGAITERAQVFASAERAWVWVEERGNLIAIDRRPAHTPARPASAPRAMPPRTCASASCGSTARSRAGTRCRGRPSISPPARSCATTDRSPSATPAWSTASCSRSDGRADDPAAHLHTFLSISRSNLQAVPGQHSLSAAHGWVVALQQPPVS